jgi:hypothetical protein
MMARVEFKATIVYSIYEHVMRHHYIYLDHAVDHLFIQWSYLSIYLCNFFQENLVGKPKGYFPTFMDGIPSKPIDVN